MGNFRIFENIIKDSRSRLLLGSHGIMFPDGRYFAVEFHSCEMFNELFSYGKIRKEEKDKFNEMIGIDKDGHIEDAKKVDKLKEILINNGFIMVQGRFEFGTKIHYSKISNEQRGVFNQMGIHIDEAKSFLLA